MISFLVRYKKKSSRLRVIQEVSKMSEEEKNKPIRKARIGRFQISIWKRKRIIKARNDFDCEREIEQVRACIQYSRFNKMTNSFDNQRVWCNPDELRSLVEVLDKLNDDVGGDEDAEPESA